MRKAYEQKVMELEAANELRKTMWFGGSHEQEQEAYNLAIKARLELTQEEWVRYLNDPKNI